MTRVKRCDELWKKVVKERAGWKCEFCTKTNKVQAHHVIPRTNFATRYLVENGVALCYRHHIHWAHKDAIDFVNWFKTNRENDYNLIENERHSIVKNNYQEIEDKLKGML